MRSSVLLVAIAAFITDFTFLIFATSSYPIQYSLVISALAALCVYAFVGASNKNSSTEQTKRSLSIVNLGKIGALVSVFFLLLVPSSEFGHLFFYVAIVSFGLLLIPFVESSNDLWEFLTLSMLLSYSASVVLSLAAILLGFQSFLRLMFLLMIMFLLGVVTLVRYSPSAYLPRLDTESSGLLGLLTMGILVFTILGGSGVIFSRFFDSARIYSNASSLLEFTGIGNMSVTGLLSQIKDLWEIGLYAFLALGYKVSSASIATRFVFDNMVWLIPAVGVAYVVSYYRKPDTAISGTVLAWGFLGTLFWIAWVYNIVVCSNCSLVDLAKLSNKSSGYIVENLTGAGLYLNHTRAEAIGLAFLAYCLGIIMRLTSSRYYYFSRAKRIAVVLITLVAFLTHAPSATIAVILTSLLSFAYPRVLILLRLLVIGVALYASVILLLRPTLTTPFILAFMLLGFVSLSYVAKSVIHKISVSVKEYIASHFDLFQISLYVKVFLWIFLIFSPLFYSYLLIRYNFTYQFIGEPPGLLPWFFIVPLAGVRLYVAALGLVQLNHDEKMVLSLSLLAFGLATIGLIVLNTTIKYTGYNLARMIIGPLMILIVPAISKGIERIRQGLNLGLKRRLTCYLLTFAIIVSGTLSLGITKAVQYYVYSLGETQFSIPVSTYQALILALAFAICMPLFLALSKR